MRKLFLLIPILAFALMANAKDIPVSSGTSNIIHYTIADDNTEDGDVLILTDAGPYISTAGADDYTKLVKNLTIKAAPGIEPVVQLEVPFRSTDGKSVKFIGITFDGTSLTSYDFYFRFYDNADNLEFEDCEFKNISKYIFDVYTGKNANSLKLTNCKLHDNSSRGILNRGTLNNLEINNCEIYNFTGNPVLDNYDGATLGKVKINGSEFYNNAIDIISGTATSHADSCIINNCYFHNNSRSAVYFAASSVSGVETCDGVVVKNSTFANNDLSASSRSVIEVQNYGATEASNIEVTVDHCTFYNNKTKNFDYSCVRSRKSTKVSITNSIFAYPSEIDFYATNCYGGTISNTLVYNLSRGHRSSGGAPAVSNTITDNPKFTDAANGDFTFAGDWVTPSVSPARGAATDGSDLGDPKWYSAETLPETDFSPSYIFLGEKALLSGSFALNGDNYIQSQDKSYAGIATWKIEAERKCVVDVTLNIAAANTSGHRYEVALYDADNNLVGTALAEPSNSWSAGDKVVGSYEIPAAGNYVVKLTNDCANSSTIIEGVTFTYIGGAVQNMPGTTNINDAWFSANGTRADGKISFPGSTIQEGWVKWNVAFANTGNYNVTLNVNSNNCKNYTVALVDANDADVVTPLTLNDCSTKGTPVALAMGAMEVPAGNYILKVTNATQNSDAELISVQFAPAGGAVQNIPGPITLNEAILSERAFIDGDGLHFVDAEHLWLMSEGYAKWNIHVAADGMYKFTANCNTDGESYSNLTIKVLKGGEEKYSFTPEYTYTGEKTINSPEWFLEAGNYELKLSNPANYSNGHLVSLSAAAVEGILIVDEMATDMQYITVLNGESRKPVLKRSFRANMYNTVVFPFNGVGDEELTSIFGAGYELLEMTSAVLDGNTLNLNFAAVNLSQNTYGRPYLIKPTQDVVNPVFSSKTIYASTSHLTVEGTNAYFIGSFIKGEVPAGENNLFLGPNNLLYFSQTATPIKGMRAWFQVKGVPNAMQAIKRANIVTSGQVITSVDFVKDANNGTLKTIENGQVVIIRDGIRYNVMGIKLQ